MQPESSEILASRHIVLGVGGGIAAYKAAELVRLLVKAGAIVDVVMTRAAQEFITPLTLQALSGRAVATELFDLVQESQIGHIALADRAELLLIAPATADLVARLSLGLGDDLLTTLALACRAPLLVAPAMNVNMWQHPSVQDNLARLVQRGAHVVGPGAGELACGWIGAGRLVEPVEIVAAARAVLQAKAALAPAQVQDLGGVRLLVTAGPTYEALDPVRFLGNRSSGKMGFALAERAARRGAEVTLVAGPVTLPTPPGVKRIDVESAAEMAEAVLPRSRAEHPEAADVIIMAAAVADFRPAAAAPRKLKKSTLGEQPRIELVPTLDILAELGRSRTGRRPLLVGFAAETHDVIGYASRKLREKRCDLLVANDVAEPGSGFGTETNRVTLIERPAAAESAQPEVSELPQLPKREVADRILDRVVELVARARTS